MQTKQKRLNAQQTVSKYAGIAQSNTY